VVVWEKMIIQVQDGAFLMVVQEVVEQILNQEDQEILLQQPRHKETMVVILFQVQVVAVEVVLDLLEVLCLVQLLQEWVVMEHLLL
jgi:hypothetical protein